MTTAGETRGVLDVYARLAERIAWWESVAARVGPLATQPPTTDGEIQSFYIGGLIYRIVPRGSGFEVTKQERADIEPDASFDRREDAEKYLVWRAADYARGRLGLPSKDLEWFRAGLDPRVRVDGAGYRRTISLPDVPGSSATFDETDEVSFSHALPVSIDELEDELRAGIPEPPAVQ